ncbi:Glutathione transport system permease protein GsiD [Anatilimnocola aggregata]|uniref:Glutathione transport system permease protein GsiD n=1 Tax=Anatilimnocola aggregata TaxID=2528021 RepID=A0A517YL34_9BACT|nr:ABC transporter permease [Anatilimnocola aggregata]QDU30939.1 Glutathione transport system permease protein GsiD [Anatilimnocola aggregata]
MSHPPPPPDSPAARAWQRFARSRAALFGAGVVTLLMVVALAADWISPYDLNATSEVIAAPPSLQHLLGTDALRKDVLTRVLHGSRLSLFAGLSSIALALGIGAPLGALAGFLGGRTDALVMRAIDVALAFPSILIALLCSAAFQPGWTTVIVAVALINVPVFARQSRATVLSMANLDYVTASRAMGMSTWQLLTRVLFPSLVGPLTVLASLSVGTAILEVAGLSFLGLGGDMTAAEWGAMLSQAKDYWSRNLWYALAPGLAISLSVLGFNSLGDGLRDALDPRSG